MSISLQEAFAGKKTQIRIPNYVDTNLFKLSSIKPPSVSQLKFNIPFSIERNYKTTFKLAGIGIMFLTLALLSGFYITDIVTTEIQLKALYTSISWLIYCSILIGTKYFNLKTKYAVRGLVFTLVFLLIAYMGNSYIFSTIA